MNTKAIIDEISKLTPEERLEVSDFILINGGEADDQAREERLKREIQKGIDSIERGEGIEFDNPEDLMASIKDSLDQARKELEAEGIKIAP